MLSVAGYGKYRSAHPVPDSTADRAGSRALDRLERWLDPAQQVHLDDMRIPLCQYWLPGNRAETILTTLLAGLPDRVSHAGGRECISLFADCL